LPEATVFRKSPGHDPEKWVPVFRKDHAQIIEIERDDDSKKSHHALVETRVNDYDLLRDYLKKQKLPEFVLSFEQIEEILDAALPRAAHRASWWETERSPQEKMPQREACLEAGYIATRQADGKSVKFKKMPQDRRRPRARRDP
jgi:hypothetical protein